MRPTLLYVDDDQPNLDSFVRSFRFDYEILVALSGMQGLEILKKHHDIALIISDQRMPQMTGIEFLRHAQQLSPYSLRIMLTAFTDNEALIKAIQLGHVYDYIVKPWSRDDLKPILDQACTLYHDRLEKIKQLKVVETKNLLLNQELVEKTNLEIIGVEDGLKSLMLQIEKVAPTDSTVLLRGESGTGKELLAKALHKQGCRADKPFIRVNCAALSPTLLESELFGHEKGAFTGAIAQKKGRFELAQGGTLFLDEIGDLPEGVQVKLLRVLQEREFERVGGHEVLKADIRLICATHQPLEQRMQEGKFREDLFFRINVIPIQVPALRDRRNDIPLLADYYLQKFAKELGKEVRLSDEALDHLVDYDWPGNVRELANVMERAIVLAESPILTADAFAQNLIETNRLVRQVSAKQLGDIREGIQNEEARLLAQALRQARGNLSEAARTLNLPRSTLVHRLKKYRLITSDE